MPAQKIPLRAVALLLVLVGVTTAACVAETTPNGDGQPTREQTSDDDDANMGGPKDDVPDGSTQSADAAGFGTDDIGVEPDLYFLGSGSIEEVILAQDDSHQSIMLVFHNPDITHFANAIDYNFHIDNVPTCGLVKLACDIEQWRDWSRDNAEFEYFDYPKNLSGQVIGH